MSDGPRFATEADLCAAFIAWVERHHGELRCYAEWEGWDILVVSPEGWQLGIQAKLRLNANVLLQALEGCYGVGAGSYSYGVRSTGPDFRGVLVPSLRGSFPALATSLGLVTIWYWNDEWRRGQPRGAAIFNPDLKPDQGWTDWNPERRIGPPETATDSIAGSPSPVTLSPWKLGALDVLAHVEVYGEITAKQIREIGISPARWTQFRWLQPVEGKRGSWRRNPDRCPRFDEQHPTAYAAAVAKARKAAPAPLFAQREETTA